MKAITVIPQKTASVCLSNVTDPTLTESTVKVKVLQVGIDGTDKEIVEGLYGQAPTGDTMLVIGHESYGEVVEVGSNVSSLSIGDKVVAMVRRPDGCPNCQAGNQDMCLWGNYTERGIKGAYGYLSEFYTEKPEYLHKVPESLGELAILLEPTSVAEKAIRMAYAVQERLLWQPKTALVTGSGTLGLLAALILRTKNLEVIVADRSDDEYKIALLNQVGIGHINTKTTPLHDIDKSLEKQIDLIVEATGNSSVALHSMMMVGTNGVVALTSITGGDTNLQICSDCLNQGLVLGNKTVVGSVNANKQDFTQGITDLEQIESTWPGLLSQLITAKFKLEQFTQALKALSDNIKVVIEI